MKKSTPCKAKRKTWRCFYCDEVFRSRRAAWLHFGDDGCIQDPPACIDPLRHDEKERMRELREARAWAMERDRRAMDLEDKIDQVNAEFDKFKRLTTCKTVHDLRMWLDSQQGRVVTANALITGFYDADLKLAEKIIG